MIMRKKVIPLILSSILLTTPLTVNAQDKNNYEPKTIQNNIHNLTENLSRGSSKPDRNASIHNLSISNYNFQLTDFGYKLYTDKWLKSSTKFISVYINDFDVIEEYGGTNDQVTISIYNESGFVSSRTLDISSGSASTSFLVTPNEKYYICFEVPTNGNRYTGYGSITD